MAEQEGSSSFRPETRFRHPWRRYQERVLSELEGHLADNRLHVVAAPGSGKTVLGLEVVRRLNRPALILAPTIAIRDQWLDRFRRLFLKDDDDSPYFVSADIRAPALLTAVTYQALHMACGGGAPAGGDEVADDEAWEHEETGRQTAEDSHGSAVGRLREHGVGTIVVDEAHHLRSEWWHTLAVVREALPEATLVALTATPPYDVSAAEWERYRDLCGPVDAQVGVPELVGRGTLCPHQDYIHFSTPSEEELARLRSFRAGADAFVDSLVSDERFADAVTYHPWIDRPNTNIEKILEDPEYFSSLLIYLNQAGREVPQQALNLLGVSARDLPPLHLEWLEVLLSRALYSDTHGFLRSRPLLDDIQRRLERIGAIQRRRVTLRSTSRIKRALAVSISKLQGIVEIARLEASQLGGDLRMVILTDFIYAADLPAREGDIKPINRIGVVPIFEELRREGVESGAIGVLSGSLVIIPREAEERLREAAAEMGVPGARLHLSPLSHDPGYLQVQVVGADQNRTVQLITRVFSSGAIRVLVGTKALLGEGWDAPCVNALVLATFVGSFMLSNQMRGRAIRSQRGNPDKTANIWHLVCVEPGQSDGGDDLETLRRRFRAFLGPALDAPVIVSGIRRMAIGRPPYSSDDVEELNDRMAQYAADRPGLREAWQSALAAGGVEAETVELLQMPEKYVPFGIAHSKTIKALALEGLLLGSFLAVELAKQSLDVRASLKVHLWLLGIALLIGAGVAAPYALKALWLWVRNGPVAGSIRYIAEALICSLVEAGIIKTRRRDLGIIARVEDEGEVFCALKGGTAQERGAYLDALRELLDPIGNPRYLLLRHGKVGAMARLDYHAVPTELGRNQGLASLFVKMWRRHVGRADLVYSRTVEGRKVLLAARSRSLSAGMQRRSERLSRWQ